MSSRPSRISQSKLNRIWLVGFVALLGLSLGGCGGGEDDRASESSSVGNGQEQGTSLQSSPSATTLPTTGGASTTVEAFGLACAPSADCTEGFLLAGVPWRVICSEMIASSVSNSVVASNEAGDVVLNEVAGFDPGYVLAADVPACGGSTWSIGLLFEPDGEYGALQRASALCETLVEQEAEWNCQHGGAASWLSGDEQRFAFFEDYVVEVEGDTSRSEHADRSDPLGATALDFYRFVATSCEQIGCEALGTLESTDEAETRVHVVLVYHPASSPEHSATAFTITLDHGAPGGTLWWLASVEQEGTVYGSDVSTATACCDDVLFDLEPSRVTTTEP